MESYKRSTNGKPAPVAMFVYNRVDNTQATLRALMANEGARDTDVYVFSDGGKDEASWRRVRAVRNYLHALSDTIARTKAFRSFTLVERPENFYLERNITEGISEVFAKHDRIIVLEDDIVTSPYFLRYMNEAFECYASTPQVMHVAGFTNLDLLTPEDRDLLPSPRADIYFTPHMSGWGWGTWRDRWQQHFRHYQTADEALQGMSPSDCDRIQYGGVFPCLRSLQRQPIPWDICWELAIYKAHGLCLTPVHTLVRNIGLSSGTHFRSYSILQRYEFDRPPLQRPIRIETLVPQAVPAIETRFARAIRDWGIRYTWLGKCIRYCYLKLRGKDKKSKK